MTASEDISPPKTTRQRGSDVLVVDPDAGVRRVITLVLQEVGCVTHTAPDAETALKLMDEVDPVLVVAEVRLPQMGGVELVKRIRERDAPAPRVLLMSAYPRPAEARVPFMPKPLRFDELLEIAREAMTP